MEPNFAPLATMAVATLTPALPYLVKAAEAGVGEVAKKTVGAAWDRASAIWDLVTAKAATSPSLAETVSELERNPTDRLALQTLELQLQRQLKTDPELVTRLRPLVDGSSTTITQTVLGDGNVVVGRDLSSSHITFNERPPS